MQKLCPAKHFFINLQALYLFMPFGKPVVVIPAFNEADCIGRTIELIKKTNIGAEIVVVNDGSTDSTGEIARELGCRVIDLKHVGKANAFFAGLKLALRDKELSKGMSSVVMMDADMTVVPKEGLQTLILEAASASAAKKIKMVVNEVLEAGLEPNIKFSGLRAFSIPAAWKLASSKIKTTARGYNLETILNSVFWHKQKNLYSGRNVFFASESAFRKGRGETQLCQTGKQPRRTRRILERKMRW